MWTWVRGVVEGMKDGELPSPDLSKPGARGGAPSAQAAPSGRRYFDQPAKQAFLSGERVCLLGRPQGLGVVGLTAQRIGGALHQKPLFVQRPYGGPEGFIGGHGLGGL